MKESHSTRDFNGGSGIVCALLQAGADLGEDGEGVSKIEVVKEAFKIMELISKEAVFEVKNKSMKEDGLSESDSQVTPVKSDAGSGDSVCPPLVVDSAMHVS